MTDFNLASRAMLVSLNVSAWGGQKIDRNVTQNVAANYDAKSGAGRYVKQLVGKDHFAGVKRASSDLRNTFYHLTQPWADNGSRILSNDGFFNFQKVMTDKLDTFRREADQFAKNYPTFKEAAQLRLGRMFDETDFPSEEEVRGYFDADMKFLPWPSAADFRCDIDSEYLDAIRQDIEATEKEAVSRAMEHAEHRLREAVSHMATRLDQYGGREKGSKSGYFRDSLVENVRELCKVLPAMNLTGDKEFDKLIRECCSKLTRADASDLRDNDGLRETVANDAKAMIEKMNSVFGRAA